MSDTESRGIHLTKEYYKDFLPTDLQWEILEIDDDFTMYDLFRLVYHANFMIPNLSAIMGMPKFDTFWSQIQQDKSDDFQDGISHLELYWSPTYDIREEKRTGKPTDQQITNCSTLKDDGNNHWDDPKTCEMSNLMEFHGIGPGCPSRLIEWHECGSDCPKDTGYGIEFTPINDLAHLPIRVLPVVEFFPPYVESDRDFSRSEFKLTINPTLWCLITSIFWELTFIGFDPDEIAESRDQLIDDIEEIKDHLEEDQDLEEYNE